MSSLEAPGTPQSPMGGDRPQTPKISATLETPGSSPSPYLLQAQLTPQHHLHSFAETSQLARDESFRLTRVCCECSSSDIENRSPESSPTSSVSPPSVQGREMQELKDKIESLEAELEVSRDEIAEMEEERDLEHQYYVDEADEFLQYKQDLEVHASRQSKMVRRKYQARIKDLMIQHATLRKSYNFQFKRMWRELKKYKPEDKQHWQRRAARLAEELQKLRNSLKAQDREIMWTEVRKKLHGAAKRLRQERNIKKSLMRQMVAMKTELDSYKNAVKKEEMAAPVLEESKDEI